MSVGAAEPFGTLRAVSEVEPLLLRREEAAFLNWRKERGRKGTFKKFSRVLSRANARIQAQSTPV